MARPKKFEDDIEGWRQRIRHAEAYLAMNRRVDTWREIREYYAGEMPKTDIRINLLFAIGRAMVPQIYYKNPVIAARPAPGVKDIALARQKAKVLEAIDLQLIEQNLLKGQYKLGILDAFRFNIFVMKHGFSSISTELPDTAANEDVKDSGSHPMVDELLSEMGLGPAPAEDMLIDEKLRKHSYHDLIQPDSPWSLRVPPEDFLVPWGARNIHEVPWCAFRIRRPLEDVQADGNYNKAVTKGMKPNWGISTGSGSQLFLPLGSPQVLYPTQYKQESHYDEGWIVFYEVWDKKTGEVKAFALDEGKDFMRREKHNLPIGLPTTIMQFNDDGEDFWGSSDVKEILPLVKERNETRTIEFQHKKLMLVKFLIDKNLIDAENRLRLTSNMPGPVVLVDGNPGNAITQVTPTVSRDIFKIDEVTRDDIREITGYSRNSMAEFEADRRTATEANIVQQNLMLRGDERRDLMGDFISQCFKFKVNPMVFAFWNKLRYVEVLGFKEPVGYIGTSLQGNYIISIAADSTLPVSQMQAKQEAMELFSLGKGDPNFNQAELYRFLLEQFKTAPVERLLIPPDQAAMQQMQMLLSMGALQGGMGGAAASGARPNTGSQQISGLATALSQGGPNAAI